MTNWGPGINQLDISQTGDGKKKGFTKVKASIADLYSKLNALRTWRSFSVEPIDVAEKEFWFNEGNNGLYRRGSNSSELAKFMLDDIIIKEGLWADSRSFGAKGDGVTDDTAALNAFFQSPAKIKVLRPGVYKTGKIVGTGLRHSIVYAYGATLDFSLLAYNAATGNDYNVLQNFDTLPAAPVFDGNLEIYGLTIDAHGDEYTFDGVVPSADRHHGIMLLNLDKVILKDVTVKNTVMTGIVMYFCNDILCDNCTVINSGMFVDGIVFPQYTWEGIAASERAYLTGGWKLLACKSFVVKNSYFENIAGSYASGACERQEYCHNRVKNNMGYLHELRQYNVHDRFDISIHDNFIDGVNSAILMVDTGTTLKVGSVGKIEIKNNVIENVGGATIRSIQPVTTGFFTYCSGTNFNGLKMEIADNYYRVSPTAALDTYGTIVSNIPEVTVKHNTFRNIRLTPSEFMLFLSGTKELKFDRNTIKTDSDYNGTIIASFAEVISIRDNNINVPNSATKYHLMSTRANISDLRISGNLIRGLDKGIYCSHNISNLQIFDNNTDLNHIITKQIAEVLLPKIVCTGNSAQSFSTGYSITPGEVYTVSNNSFNSRKILFGTAAPTTGTWVVGDEVVNLTPSEAGSAGSKYIVYGWKCVATGTPGTWLAVRTLTGN